MRSAIFTGQFKRDVKLAEKRGKDIGKLRDVIELLLADPCNKILVGFNSLAAG